VITGRTATVAAAVLGAAAATAVVGPRGAVVDGLSMAPDLLPGDVVTTGWLPLLDRLRRPRRFERWIVSAADGTAAIKRVAGLPGEAIAIQDGDLIIDGARGVKDPARLAEVALPVAGATDRESAAFRMPSGDVLDDVSFAAEVNRPLEAVADVGFAALIRSGSDGSRACVGLGGGRLVWRLPPAAACRLIAGRLDGRLVAVAWQDRGPALGDDHRGPLPRRVPTAWQIERPWPQGRGGPAETGGTLEVDEGGIIEQVDVWRDVHHRPHDGGPTAWRLGADAYLMLGDFPTASVDSRAWGPRPRHALRHRVDRRP